MKSLPVIVALSAALAQVPAQQRDVEPTLSVTTNLVTLSVTVVDRHGALVGGLRQEQFTVYDNGEPQAIELFTNEDLPATIGLLVDSSASMRGRQTERAAAAAAFAEMHHPLDEFFVLNFNEAVWPGLPPPLAFTDDPVQLRQALFATPSAGMTALYDALERAMDHLRLGSLDRKALIVVSDGGDNASRHTLDEVLDRARRAGAAIYAVTLVDPDDRDAKPRVLKDLARETGGHAFTPHNSEEVLQAFTRIALEIRSGYTIGFTPADASAVGYRAIRVVADAGDGRPLAARTRGGYYAGP